MKVRCVTKDSWLIVGKEYSVLGIYGRVNSIKYRIVTDRTKTLALHDAKYFELASHNIPRGWIFKTYPSSEWEISPAPLAKDGFWVDFFDENAAAKATFAAVLKELDSNDESE